MNVEITVYPGLRWENWSQKTSQGRQPQTSDSNKHYMQRNKPIFSKGSREKIQERMTQGVATGYPYRPNSIYVVL